MLVIYLNVFTLYIFLAGDSVGGSNLVPFQPLSSADSVAGVCEWTDPPLCVAVPLSSLQWHLHGDHQYVVTLMLTSLSGLNKWVQSVAYEHYTGPPLPGIVIELPLGGVSANEVTICVYF